MYNFYDYQEHEAQKPQAATRGIPIRWQKPLFVIKIFKNF